MIGGLGARDSTPRALFRGFLVVFPWLFRGLHFGQILRVLALENPKGPAVLKTLRVVNHYRDSNLLPQ